MPVPFGVSVGDFIAGIEFIHSVCEALESATGSKAQYQGVVEALQSVRDALHQLSALEASAQGKLAVNNIIDRIRQTLLRYDAKINKYEASLGNCKTTKRWTAIPKKIQWQRYSKDDVLWFQNEIVQHLSSLQIILSNIQYAANHKVAQTIDGSLARVEQHITQSASSLQAQSTESETIIRLSVDQCRLATLSGFQQVENTARQLHGESDAAAQARFEITLAVLLHIYRDIRRGMFLFCVCVMNAINLVHQIMSRLPPRMLTHASTIFEDAHGMICHINTQFVQSWRAFNYVVRDNFRGRPGLLRVTTGKYRLHDRFGSSEINTLQPFTSVFRPGRHIRQSILFEWNEVPLECCPKCKHRQALNVGYEVECNECGLWYRKLQSSGDQRSSEFNREASTPYQAPESSGEDVPRTGKKTKVVKDVCRPEDFLRIAISAMPDLLKSDTPEQHHLDADDWNFKQNETKNRAIQKMILAEAAEALRKANTAVQLANDQDYEGAISAYFDACELLETAMDRTSVASEKEALDAIRVPYVNRIEELRSLLPDQVLKGDNLPVAGLSTIAEQVEGSRVNGTVTQQQEEPVGSDEDDSGDLISEHSRENPHGQFTGGFADDYFNSIGSSASWIPRSDFSTVVGKRVYPAEDIMTRVDLLDQMEERDNLVGNHLTMHQEEVKAGDIIFDKSELLKQAISPARSPSIISEHQNPASGIERAVGSVTQEGDFVFDADFNMRNQQGDVILSSSEVEQHLLRQHPHLVYHHPGHEKLWFIDPEELEKMLRFGPGRPDLLAKFAPYALDHAYTNVNESTPTPTNLLPRYLEPKPDMAPPTPTLGGRGPLPTPQLTPLSLASMQERSAQRGASLQSSTILQRS